MGTGTVNDRPSDSTWTSCEVRDWVVFGPGYHKGELYSPDRVRRIADNFARLKGHLTPVVKIGHDRQQRLAQSLGFPNCGRVSAVRLLGDDTIALTLVGVPVAVGGEISAGRLNSGSVELVPHIADPDDPARTVDGPVLIAVAFLGEEQPALKGFGPPCAVYPDGSPVPPAADASPWLAAMAEVAREPARQTLLFRGREYPTTTICFSEMTAMRDRILAELKAKGVPVDDPDIANKSDAELQELLDSINTSGYSAAMRKMYAANPADTDGTPPPPPGGPGGPGQKKGPAAGASGDQPKWFRQFADDCNRRLGALEKAYGDARKHADDATDQAFSERVERAVDDAVTRGVLQPWQRTAFVAYGKTLGRSRTYSDGPYRGRTEFDVWVAGLAAGRPTSLFADAVADNPQSGTGAVVSSHGAAILEHLRDVSPRVVKRLLG